MPPAGNLSNHATENGRGQQLSARHDIGRGRVQATRLSLLELPWRVRYSVSKFGAELPPEA